MSTDSPTNARRVFKNKWFARFTRGQGIADRELCEAIARAERGLIDADLGGGVIKQRIARTNEGKSGGFRSIVLFQAARHSFFVYGFAKNERDNISREELKEFRALAGDLLALDETQLQIALDTEKIIEVNCHDQDL